MIRQATVILPCHLAATEQLRRDLLREFGGYTQSACTGAWRDPATGLTYEDVNSRFDVGVEDTPEIILDKLRSIARWAGQAADQQCVYLLAPSGEVEFVNCKPANDDAGPSLALPGGGFVEAEPREPSHSEYDDMLTEQGAFQPA